MYLLFWKKITMRAMAVTLENGREIADIDMRGILYRNRTMKEPKFDVAVRVTPPGDPAYDAVMKAPLGKCFLLLPGVTVQVKYDPRRPKVVELDDELQDILDRNPQLRRREP